MTGPNRDQRSWVTRRSIRRKRTNFQKLVQLLYVTHSSTRDHVTIISARLNDIILLCLPCIFLSFRDLIHTLMHFLTLASSRWKMVYVAEFHREGWGPFLMADDAALLMLSSLLLPRGEGSKPDQISLSSLGSVEFGKLEICICKSVSLYHQCLFKLKTHKQH